MSLKPWFSGSVCWGNAVSVCCKCFLFCYIFLHVLDTFKACGTGLLYFLLMFYFSIIMHVITLESWNSHCIDATTLTYWNMQVTWRGIQMHEKEKPLWFQKLRIWIMSCHLLLHFQGMLEYVVDVSIHTIHILHSHYSLNYLPILWMLITVF